MHVKGVCKDFEMKTLVDLQYPEILHELDLQRYYRRC